MGKKRRSFQRHCKAFITKALTSVRDRVYNRDLIALRPLYIALGILSVGLGYVGLLVPGMPSFVFFLIALWAFQRSSPRFEQWLLENPLVGPTLRDWNENHVMRPRTKVVAISMMWATMLVSIAILIVRHRPPWIPVLIAAIGVGVTMYILSIPSGEKAGQLS